MAKIQDGGPAFPREDYQCDDAPGQRGMSLRDWFAGRAMAAFITSSDTPTSVAASSDPDKCAVWAYEQADAMLSARGQAV